MIGAAETSYFVDSIKEKIDRDVETTQDIALRSEQTAQTTEQIAANAERASTIASEVCTESIAGRVDVDQGQRQIYKPIPNTDPPKHTTAFDAFTDRVLPAWQENILDMMPPLAYAGGVDNNGYFPTHNRKFSKPLTGGRKCGG